MSTQANGTSDITDVGDASYELVKPVLIKIENPEQLVRLLLSDLRYPIDINSTQLRNDLPI